MIIVEATFKGRDGSLGLEAGKKYTIKLIGSIAYIEGVNEKKLWSCPYGSSEAFLTNWTSVDFVMKVTNHSELLNAFDTAYINSRKAFKFFSQEIER